MVVDNLPDRLLEILQPAGNGTSSSQDFHPAAVLAVLYKTDGEWHLLFTHRAENIGPHAGQVSFPGGKTEPQDTDLLSTALRETDEEIGVRRSDIRILGQLTTFPTGTGYLVTPFVGQIPWPYPLKINPEEVASVFSVPIRWLLSPANFTRREKPLLPELSSLPSIRFKPFQDHTIWGATAWITYELMQIIEQILEK